MEDSSTRSWDRIADDWIAHADSNDYRNIFLIPHTMHLLGEVAGKSILDLGCGEGGYSRILASRGAVVTGIDGSERLIEIARQRAAKEDLPVGHQVLNANSLAGIDNGSFDIVLAAMSLMDVEDYDGAVAEIHRVLKNGGELLMSITHPCFSGRGSSWRRTSDGVLEHYAVDNYQSREAWDFFMTPRFTAPVLFRHMPLQDFIRPLLGRGFRLILFDEPAATPEQISRAPRLRKLDRVPLFLFMRWFK